MMDVDENKISCMANGEGVSVIGSGNMGRAIAHCLLNAGFKVHIGSRDPGTSKLISGEVELAKASIVTIKEAVQENNIIFLCLHFAHIESLVEFQDDFDGKIIIDVSNREIKNNVQSNAEIIQRYFSKSIVVKAFNTWSSYSLLNRYSIANKDVHLASNNETALNEVSRIIRRMSLNPVTHIGLENARQIEERAIGAVKTWKKPLITAAFIFIAWFLYSFIRFHIIKHKPFSRLPLHIMNKILGAVALTTLSLVYMPWNFAAILQLVNKSSAIAFPAFLDTWLKIRRELGLLATWFACIHGLTSLALSQAYLATFYPKWTLTIPLNHTVEQKLILVPPTQNWQGELTFLLGCLAVGILVVPTVTSLPSIQSILNQEQWYICQSVLGHISLFIATVHVAVKSSPTWDQIPFSSLMQKLSILTLILPTITMILRLILLLPCLRKRLHFIRRGGVLKQSRKTDV